MAELPSASVVIDDEAGAFGGGTGHIVVMSCVQQNADLTPRVYGSTKSLLAQHGYSPGASYVAMHIEKTRKPIIFIGLPTVTAGTIGRQNSTGVTGTSAITVAAGAAGVLEEVDGVVTVTKGGTIGAAGIELSISMDGGRIAKPVRLGTATSYTIPYVGLILNFGAGTLVAGDVYTFSSTAPLWDGTGIQDAREALATQLKLARSWMVIGDVPTSTLASAVVTQANAYETENQRFVYARIGVRDRLPLASLAKVTKRMTGAPNITFAEVGGTGDTITRSAGSFIADGFAVGDIITVTGAVASSGANNVTGPIASLSATVITLGTTDLVAEGPIGGVSISASPGLIFAEVGASGDTITRSSGSWLADGFRVGDTVTIAGTVSNNVTGAIAALSATVLTFGTTDLAAEEIRSDLVTIGKGETMAAWVASLDAEFGAIDSQKRIDIAIGRARKVCPITGWSFRRPAAWHLSIRENEHDLHIPTFRKADGPLDGVDLEDDDGLVVEFDQRTDGGGLEARFSCLRTFGNGPRGAFAALSLTRASEGSLLSRTHNMAVANLVCSVTQAETENAIGQVLVLTDEGKGTDASLALIEERVNSSLEIAVLQQRTEGQRASKCVWRERRDDILNIPGAELTGVVDLNLNGTLEKISTSVRIQTAGA